MKIRRKAAKYHNRVALPLRPVTVDGPPFPVPRYLHLDLGRQTQRSWHISGYIPIRCVPRQEAGNIMMVPVISVVAGNSRQKTRSFPVSLHANVFFEASHCRLVS